jgi:hypothetical protein
MDASSVHFRSKGGDLRKSFKADYDAFQGKDRQLETVDVSTMYVMSPKAPLGSSRHACIAKLIEAVGVSSNCLTETSRPVCNIATFTYSSRTHVTLSILTPLISTAAIQVRCKPIPSEVEELVKTKFLQKLDSSKWKATIRTTRHGCMLNGKYSFELYDELIKALPDGHTTNAPSFSLVGIHGTSFTLSIARSEDPSTMYPQGLSNHSEAEVIRPCYARAYVMSTDSIMCFGRYIINNPSSALTVELNASVSKAAVFRLRHNHTTTPISMSRNGRINGSGDLETLTEVLKEVKDEMVRMLENATTAREFISTLATS